MIGVVGANGLIGRAVVEALVTSGHSVCAYYRAASSVDATEPSGSMTTERREFNSDDGLSIDLSSIDVVVNCAGVANASGVSEADLLAANAELPLNLLGAAEAAKVKHLVHVSTAKVYEGHEGEITADTNTKPVSRYAVSKLKGDEKLMGAERSTVESLTLFRPPPVWTDSGGRTRSIGRLVRTGVPVPSLRPPATRSFVALDSLADRIARAAVSKPTTSTRVVLPVDKSPRSVIELLSAVAGQRVRTIPVPAAVLRSLDRLVPNDLRPLYVDEIMIDSEVSS